jgi:GDPmannose 4,6-dehydratase
LSRALITGITGQDGSYLAEFLLAKGYEVHGIVHPAEFKNAEKAFWRIRGIESGLKLHAGDLSDAGAIGRTIEAAAPAECYHLAAQSFVSYSANDEVATLETNIKGTHTLLAGLHEKRPECRFFFASSGEMFGRVKEVPQNENTPFHPRSPYGISKVSGFNLTRYYREGRGMFAASGILYNHESPRRGLEFVTRKITHAAARISLGLDKELRLGNLDAARDWGHAVDYVPAMWSMLQQSVPDDFVLATGESHTVREFCDAAFSHVGLDYKKSVVVDERFFRPLEEEILRGDSSKARRVLGWKPQRSFHDLVREMVDADVAVEKQQR